MIRKLCTLTLSFIFAINACIAQQVIFKENFDHMPGLGLSNGWLTTATGAVGWRTSDMYNLYCSYSYIPQYKYWAKVAAISGCYGDKGGPRNNRNVLAYTKAINLAIPHPAAFLKFDSYFNKMLVVSTHEKATVEISTNDGSSWNVLYEVPAGSTPDSFATWYLNLSQYIGYNNVRIGFRYSDQGMNQKFGGWAIDNIEIYRPDQKDLALEIFSPTDSMLKYTTVNNAIIHTGTVMNKGIDTIHSFVVNYKRDNGYTLSDTITATLPPLSKYHFSHAIPDTIGKAGNIDITAWVETTGDLNTTNDTVFTKVHGAYFMPDKLVAVEEGTGTWNMFAPMGYVFLNTLNSDYNACLVSIHSSDPMDLKPYSDYFYSINYSTPHFFMIDRKAATETSFFNTFHKHSKHFGFADLELHGNFAGDWIDIGVAVKPAIDMTGDFRLLLVLTEDGVKGTGKGWEQENMHYTGGRNGTMGGYENKPDPVPAQDMTYNYVARMAYPGPDGGKTFATELKHNGSYFHKFNLKLDPAWDKNRLRAIVMLLRNDDTLILNSNKLNYFLSVASRSSEDINTGIYPNPAHLYTRLQFESTGQEKADVFVTDVSGRRLFQLQIPDTKAGINTLDIPTADFPTGLYIINILTPKTKHALKLHVMH